VHQHRDTSRKCGCKGAITIVYRYPASRLPSTLTPVISAVVSFILCTSHCMGYCATIRGRLRQNVFAAAQWHQ